MITASSVSSIPLTYASAPDWSVFNATNLASAGNLQANFTDIVSAVSAQYKPALNSCIAEINYLEGVSGAYYVGYGSSDSLGSSYTSYLADNMYLGATTTYSLKPTAGDKTAALNTYFDALYDKGLKYALFDMPGDYAVTGDLTDAYKVNKIGNAKIVKTNLDNWFMEIIQSFNEFTGKINSHGIQSLNEKLDTGIFKQIALAISQNRKVKTCFFGDSITSTGGSGSDGDMSLRCNSTGVAPGWEFSPTGQGLTPGDSYAFRFMDMLVSAFPDSQFTYTNFGIGGENINSWYTSVTFEGIVGAQPWIDFCKDAIPDLIVIGFGMNDVSYDLSLNFAYNTKKVIDYIKANFSPVPDIVFVTTPRPCDVPGATDFGTAEQQFSRFNAANVCRSIAQEYGAYVCDVGRLSDIKRVGLDYTKPMHKTLAASDINLYLTGNAVDNGNGTYTLTSNSYLWLCDPYWLKDFTLRFTVNAVSPTNVNALTAHFNNVGGGHDNQIAFYPKNLTNVGEIKSYMRVADAAEWAGDGGYQTQNFVNDVALDGMDVTFTIEKRGSKIEVRTGTTREYRMLRDYADSWDVPGYIQLVCNTLEAGASFLVSNIEVFGVEYPQYMPCVTEIDMWGEYVFGDNTAKDPYGGSGNVHPSAIGIEEVYVPALRELTDDIVKTVSINNRNTIPNYFPVTETLNSTDSEAGYSYITLGTPAVYPILTCRLVAAGGTVYKLNKTVMANTATDRAKLGANEFGMYITGTDVQLLIKSVAAVGWVVTTYGPCD
jgi:lysophospholipase L1-like esterase